VEIIQNAYAAVEPYRCGILLFARVRGLQSQLTIMILKIDSLLHYLTDSDSDWDFDLGDADHSIQVLKTGSPNAIALVEMGVCLQTRI
jgi:hypothetical protein